MRYFCQHKTKSFIINILISISIPNAGLAQIIHSSPVLILPEINDHRNSICYMQRSDGVILSLDSLCGTEEIIPNLSPVDQSFITNYKQLLTGYPEENILLPLVESNPQAIVKKAKDVCDALDSGTFMKFRTSQPPIDVNTINVIAPKYYCPGFDN